ncbi:MAG: efflux RND transporter periplasmic adaptor subunit [Rhodospirillaceae bacterium]|nr:efflux RND transporter periplasmic adaptor subunit [Rhodospirillaceae bacterium]
MLDTQTPIAPAKLKRAGAIAALVLAAIVVAGTASRILSYRSLAAWTAEQVVPTVNVVKPKDASVGTMALPGRIQAWAEAPVYARTSGYLRKWYADIGQEVKAGELLGEIDAPDLDQQLQAATAALATAEAQRALAEATASRADRLVGQAAVSQQEADQRRSDLAAKTAMRQQAKANVDQLRAMTGFKRLVAPFDGKVISRTTDVGALIAAGQGGNAVPLFTVSDTSKLRIYVNVPQSDAGLVSSGLKASFTVPEFPGRSFDAEIARTSDAVNTQGAMLVQLIFDNHENLLKPGGYAQVSLEIPKTAAAGAVRIPASALLFRREGISVAVVGADGVVAIRPITIGQDDGAEVEVASGLTREDRVIDSPMDAIATGDKVRISAPADSGKKANAG